MNSLKVIRACIGLPVVVLASPNGPVQNVSAPKSFAFVLQAETLGSDKDNVVVTLAHSGRDWIILDPDYDGESPWSAEDIAAVRSGRPERKVLAYLSIGEAEDYRDYWQESWDADRDGSPDSGAPDWLTAENPDWEGNYKVCYWKPEWQAITLERLRSVQQAGFDGVYLDIVDAFEFFEYDNDADAWEDNRQNPDTSHSYRQDMIAWVECIAEQVRKSHPGFIVVPQNGVQLLEYPEYVRCIDAVGVEDLFTEGNRLLSAQDSAFRLDYLRAMEAAGKPVLLVEYGSKPKAVEQSFAKAREHGFVPLVTDRALKTLGQSPGSEPATAP